MDLATLAIALSGAGVLVTGALAVLFLRDPVAGMAITRHRPQELPQIMADRYVAMVALALAATVYGDLKVIAVLFGAFGYMGLHDAWVYLRAGHSWGNHLAAGVAGMLVCGVAGAAALGWGTA